MSKTKKVLSVILAVAMAFGALSLCAFAATETATWTLTVNDSTNTTAVSSVNVDDVITVNVALATDYFVGSVGIPVHYDTAAFEYVADSAVLSSIHGTDATYLASSNGVVGAGVFFASYVPKSSAAGVAAPKFTASTVVLTFQLKAIAATAAAADNIYLAAADQKTAANVGGKLYCGSHATADVATEETVYGQTFVLTNAAKKVAVVAASADPVLTGVDTGYVDTAKGYVYGIPVGTSTADFANYFTVENGTFEVSGNGTGATLTVKTAGGATFATYTVVIFGDVDGSGTITSDDYVAVKSATMGSALAGAFGFAANVDGLNEITSDDYVAVKSATMGVALSVNPYAA